MTGSTAAMIRTRHALIAAIDALGAHAGVMLLHRQSAWSSPSFEGSRHHFDYAFDGAKAVEHGEGLIEILPDHEFDIPGHLVADACVTDVMHRASPPRLEVTLEFVLVQGIDHG